MPKAEIEEFAKILIREVRDVTIESCDMSLEPNTNSPTAKRWRDLLGGSPKELGKTIIPDCVDRTLFYLLRAVDSGTLRISFVASNGKTIDLTDEGMSELGGWYAAVDPWIMKYSKQRYVDDLEDLS